MTKYTITVKADVVLNKTYEVEIEANNIKDAKKLVKNNFESLEKEVISDFSEPVYNNIFIEDIESEDLND